jgi:hypothetical protein
VNGPQQGWYDAGVSGPLTADDLDAFLRGPASAWLAKLATLQSDGWPSVSPLWYQWDGTDFLVVGRARSAWVHDLMRDSRCALCIEEAEPPPLGASRRVLAQCHAEIVEGPVVAAGSQWVEVAREMALRYTGSAGLEGLAASYDWPRYLVRMRPRNGKLTTWKGAAWHPRYTEPSG